MAPVFKESAGVHTWANWADYSNEFATQLFQYGRPTSRAVVARLIADHGPLA
jgi:hypothetical protein